VDEVGGEAAAIGNHLSESWSDFDVIIGGFILVFVFILTAEGVETMIRDLADGSYFLAFQRLMIILLFWGLLAWLVFANSQ